MPQQAAARRRRRGHIRQRGGSYQVLVYAGDDPLTGKPNYLVESTTTEKKAERLLTRMLADVDEQRNARTKATLGAALDTWLGVHDAEEKTLNLYETYIRRHIKPALGTVPVGKVTAQMLEQFYAELRRCRVRCNGRIAVDHRVDGPHECNAIRHRRRRPHNCTEARCTHLTCQPHRCVPLAASTIRQIHFTISAALAAAVRREWVKVNPAEIAKKPRQPRPQPDPPSADEVTRILQAAWAEDETWGTLVWLTMVTGMRRGELLALRWTDIDFDQGLIDVRRSYVWVRGRGVEKDTKTHQMRRIALDPATVDVLTAHRERYLRLFRAIGGTPTERAFVFSADPAGAAPFNPDVVTHRYVEMCSGLGIDSHLHALRHYSATELLSAGVDLRTVAGRLGHGGGGATTLRVYAAWVGEADRRAAEILGSRLRRPSENERP
jgi:integrase